MEYFIADGVDCSTGGFSGRKKGHPRHKGAGSSRADIEARFWLKVIKTEGCWIWNARRLDAGYGMFRMGNTMNVAHRVSYTLTNGDIPKGLFVCHKCDNPSCVRPDHLFLGTHKDNMQDRKTKGRFKKCSESNKKKLGNESIREIRATKITRGVISSLAKKFNVARITIRRVINGESYKAIA